MMFSYRLYHLEGTLKENHEGKIEFRKKVTAMDLFSYKERGEKIAMITAYDYPSAKLADEIGADCILVGDSLGMVVLGYENTLPVTMADMLHHCKAVARGAKSPLLIGDMPFLSYQASTTDAIINAGRLLAEGGMGAVKLEGGREQACTIRAIVDAGIPVMGHIGLTPQSVHKLGGFRPRGRTSDEAMGILEDAIALQEAGCFALVLESVPVELSRLIGQTIGIPVIGIGAGVECDGQVLVLHDAVGLTDTYQPKFTRKFVETRQTMADGLAMYIAAVKDGSFPAEDHTVHMKDLVYQDLLEEMKIHRKLAK